MRRVREGTIGIVPAGALGVGFFYHLTGQLARNDGTVFFIERTGSKSAEALRISKRLRIESGGRIHEVDATPVCRGDLLKAFEERQLPDVLLVCTNPDQLGGVLNDYVQLIERSYAAGEFEAIELPVLVLCSNGIYFQRQRQLFVERLEESTLLGRLPDLWPDVMPRIVGRLLRGVTIQTGVRDGVGVDAIYQPGPSGITRLAGGDTWFRERTAEILCAHGGWFEVAPHSSATRLEFDKAMVNLTVNLLGQLFAIDEAGRFTPLRVREIVTPEHERAMRELVVHVLAVGRAVKAYGPTDNVEDLHREMLDTNHQHDDHVPSSLQWVGLRMRHGELEAQLTPTEAWLIEPLIRYAHAAGLNDSAIYFEQLRDELLRKLTLAARLVGQAPSPANSPPAPAR